MRRTNSKEVKAAVRNYLTEVAQSEELNTIKDIKNKFINEYGWAVARLGERNACRLFLACFCGKIGAILP